MHQCMKFISFRNDTLHVSDGLSVHHQEFKTVHTATGICQTDTADCLLASRQQYLFDKCMLLYVESSNPDDGWKDRPKHVDCHSKIKQIWYIGVSSWFNYIHLSLWCRWGLSAKTLCSFTGPWTVNIWIVSLFKPLWQQSGLTSRHFNFTFVVPNFPLVFPDQPPARWPSSLPHTDSLICGQAVVRVNRWSTTPFLPETMSTNTQMHSPTRHSLPSLTSINTSEWESTIIIILQTFDSFLLPARSFLLKHENWLRGKSSWILLLLLYMCHS